jgi:hypothetical protein
VAKGAITLLSAPEKCGKTTLLSLLLDRCRAGGQLLGRAVQPSKTVLCSEENRHLWSLRQPPLDFGPELLFFCPVGDCPSRRSWRHYIDELIGFIDTDDFFNLLVIDTAVRFIPLAVRNPRPLRWALAKLALVARFPAGVLILNQSRNVHRPLAAFADIVIDMSMPRRHPRCPRSGNAATAIENADAVEPAGTRRRIFTGVGRYPGTLRSVTAELNADGTDYVLAEASPPPPNPLLATVETLLAASSTPLTRQELLARWPGHPPHPDSLWRTLSRAAEHGRVTITGTGTKTDDLRYALGNRTPLPD